jgi:hypothetical protein
VLGRPGEWCGCVRYRLTSARCQRIRVLGVTNRWVRRALGGSPASVVITATSAEVRRGRLICRRRIAFSWRSSRISAVLAASSRVRTASQARPAVVGRSSRCVATDVLYKGVSSNNHPCDSNSPEIELRTRSQGQSFRFKTHLTRSWHKGKLPPSPADRVMPRVPDTFHGRLISDYGLISQFARGALTMPFHIEHLGSWGGRPMAQELRLRAPSGNVLALGLPEDPGVSGTTTSARFVGSRFARAVQIGSLGFQAVANESLMPAEVTERYIVDGYEVRMAVGSDGINASVALIGAYHEAVTIFSGPPPRREAVTLMFQQFAFRDTPEGMAVLPRPNTGLSLSSEAISIYVDGRGSLNVPGASSARDLIPPYRGTSTRYGELWRSGPLEDRRDDGANAYVYILGTRTAAAEIIFPDRSEYHGVEHPVVGDGELLAWLYELNPRWGE